MYFEINYHKMCLCYAAPCRQVQERGERSQSCWGLSGSEQNGECQQPKRNTPSRKSCRSRNSTLWHQPLSYISSEHREGDFWWGKMTKEAGKGVRRYGVTDRANGKALHQQWQGRGRAKQVLLSHPNKEVTETSLKTWARLGFVLRAQTRTKMGPNKHYFF